ncbi:DNA binding protein, nucleoid-associated [Oligella ureolytica]|uniref:DNA binding protein, nucleoid-associated n=1 Tax=Oligella ureolytica TaxID=90244 RepID=A0A379B186_9BURK|nr:H-NS histone family protein [Oligella ureolytica]QPT38934.1 H-NS histone family protein [Oligella ureolytica]SUB29828.1 DNA binding protein, nucleoid-associated [Oligella ureolytica]
MTDLKNMNADELRSLRAKIDSELKKREAKERQEARKKIIDIAKTHGINIAELAKNERLYRNPDNQWETWTGRGRKPKWVKEWLEAGRSLEELEVS